MKVVILFRVCLNNDLNNGYHVVTLVILARFCVLGADMEELFISNLVKHPTTRMLFNHTQRFLRITEVESAAKF